MPAKIDKPKRPRPRPNMIHVDMSDQTRDKLDKCVLWLQADHPMHGITQTVQLAIESLHAKIFG